MIAWGWASVDARGAHDAGQRAAGDALARLAPGLALAYDGGRPVVAADRRLAVSISHGRSLAVAVASRCPALGVDLCELDRGARIRAIAERYFTPAERALLVDDRAAAYAWAAKEAGLKAMGLGLLDGGVFDRACPVILAALDRYAAPVALALELAERDGCAIALAYTAPSTSTVAPLM